MVDFKLMAAGVLAVVVSSSCASSRICYPTSSAEIESLIAAGECKDLLMRDVSEATMRFTNDDPTVSIYIDIDYNPAVRRVEADGRGKLISSRIDEVVRTNTNCSGIASRARLLDFTIGDRGDGQPNFCNLDPEPGSMVRLAAEEGVVVAGIGAFADDWSSVTLEVDENA